MYRLKSKMKVILYALGFRVCKMVAGWMFCHWRKVMVIGVFYCTRGLGAGIFLQFCELLGGLVMTHKRTYPNSAAGGREHF